MKIKTDLEQINERLDKVNECLKSLINKRKYIDKLVHQKLFGIFGFLIPKSTSSLLFEQEELIDIISYLEGYQDMLLKQQVEMNNEAVRK